MNITGADYIQRLVDGGTFEAKMVFNERGAIIFAAQRQHRETKGPGISYEDDDRSNALAAILKPDLIQIRGDRRISGERVAGMLRRLLACPELVVMRGWRVTYQGRIIAIWSGGNPARPHPPGTPRP